MKTKNLFMLVLLLSLFYCQVDRNTNDANHYEIKLRLDPAGQYIRVDLDLTLIPVISVPEKLVYYLHKQFTIREVSGRGITSYKFDRDSVNPANWIPEGRAVAIDLDREIIGKKALRLHFEYEGNISEWPGWSANVISADWVELGLYLPWFPYNQAYEPFTFAIEVECDPNYQLRSFGDFEKKSGKWFFKWMSPATDIVLVAAKDLKTVKLESSGKRINIHYSAIAETTAKKLAVDLTGILDLYEAWFAGSKKGEITLIESLRKRGGGYARAGLISLAGLSDEKYATQHEVYIRYLAHEAGHIWWHMAPKNNWQDWLNEGLAEFSALLVIEEMFGEAAFDKRIETKSKNIRGKRPIWGFDRNDRSTEKKSETIESILYSKGPVLLNRLMQRIGRDKFKTLCKEMVESSTSSTEEFITLLTKNHGAELGNWFADLLKTF